MEYIEIKVDNQTYSVIRRKHVDVSPNDRSIELIEENFSPVISEKGEGKGVIFYPGWSAGSAATIRELCQRYANTSRSPVISIRTKPLTSGEGSLEEEALASTTLIKERGLERVIAVGHSEGAVKAAYLTRVEGLSFTGVILHNPVGLYEQTPSELGWNFTRDSLLDTSLGLITHPRLLPKALQAGWDIVGNIADSLVNYPHPVGRLMAQIKEMARTHSIYRELTCRVIVSLGDKDRVAQANRIMPHLDSLFPKAWSIGVYEYGDMGYHGLPHFRPQDVVDDALHNLTS